MTTSERQRKNKYLNSQKIHIFYKFLNDNSPIKFEYLCKNRDVLYKHEKYLLHLTTISFFFK